MTLIISQFIGHLKVFKLALFNFDFIIALQKLKLNVQELDLPFLPDSLERQRPGWLL